MGITPFFVENVSELQLCAIKLVTAVSLCGQKILSNVFGLDSFFFLFFSEFSPFYNCYDFLSLQVFSRYEKHRQLILEEIFTSLARLPTSKRSLRNFRLLDYYLFYELGVR